MLVTISFTLIAFIYHNEAAPTPLWNQACNTNDTSSVMSVSNDTITPLINDQRCYDNGVDDTCCWRICDGSNIMIANISTFRYSDISLQYILETANYSATDCYITYFVGDRNKNESSVIYDNTTDQYGHYRNHSLDSVTFNNKLGLSIVFHSGPSQCCFISEISVGAIPIPPPSIGNGEEPEEGYFLNQNTIPFIIFAGVIFVLGLVFCTLWVCICNRFRRRELGKQYIKTQQREIEMITKCHQLNLQSVDSTSPVLRSPVLYSPSSGADAMSVKPPTSVKSSKPRLSPLSKNNPMIHGYGNQHNNNHHNVVIISSNDGVGESDALNMVLNDDESDDSDSTGVREMYSDPSDMNSSMTMSTPTPSALSPFNSNSTVTDLNVNVSNTRGGHGIIKKKSGIIIEAPKNYHYQIAKMKKNQHNHRHGIKSEVAIMRQKKQTFPHHKRRYTSPAVSEIDVDEINIASDDDEMKSLQSKSKKPRRSSMDTASIISNAEMKSTRKYSNEVDDIYIVNEIEKQIRRKMEQARNATNLQLPRNRAHTKQFSLTLQSGLNAEKIITEDIVNDMVNADNDDNFVGLE